jgi:hypothetical protein
MCYDMDLIVFTKTTIMEDLPSELILLVEMKAQERTIRDQPIGVWCILSISYFLQLKWNHPFKVIKQTLTTSKTCFFRELLSYLSLRSP